MELIEIRKKAIEYCESLSRLTDKEKEIAYKAYVAALSSIEKNVSKATSKVYSPVTNSISSSDRRSYACMKPNRKIDPCSGSSSKC